MPNRRQFLAASSAALAAAALPPSVKRPSSVADFCFPKSIGFIVRCFSFNSDRLAWQWPLAIGEDETGRPVIEEPLHFEPGETVLFQWRRPGIGSKRLCRFGPLPIEAVTLWAQGRGQIEFDPREHCQSMPTFYSVSFYNLA